MRFLSTSPGARVFTQYGCVYERAPLLDDDYEVDFVRDTITVFKNVTNPHHTVMWWLEDDYVCLYRAPRFPAVYSEV